MTFRVICAWCHQAEKVDGIWGPLAAPIRPGEIVSHGMCPSCEAAFRAELDL